MNLEYLANFHQLLNQIKKIGDQVIFYNKVISDVQLHLHSMFRNDNSIVDKIVNHSFSDLTDIEERKFNSWKECIQNYWSLLYHWEMSKNSSLVDLYEIGHSLNRSFKRHCNSLSPETLSELQQIAHLLSPVGFWVGNVSTGHIQRLDQTLNSQVDPTS